MKQYKMWIGGKWVDADSGKTFPVFNPATEEVIAELPLGDKRDVDKAVEAARKALPVWSRKSQMERSQIVLKIAALIKENVQEFAKIDTLDHGMPVQQAAGRPSGSVNDFEWAAFNTRSLMGHTIPVSPDELAYLQWEPVGVVALITPWNVPLGMITERLGPALAMGNTVVIKPPSVDALAAFKLAELLATIDTLGLPPGTVNLITGPGGSVGEALASHRGVDMISFTGSSETGKSIMAAASHTIKRLQLELGGKNPVIILDDADVDTAAAESVTAQYKNCGQICASPGRFYIHEKVYDRFLEKFIEGSKKYIVGDPVDPKTQMGPVVSAEHRDRIEGYIKSAIDEGAKVILGGKRPTTPPMDKGYWVMPTIITDITQKMKVAREEIFGPVACIMQPFNSDEQVIAWANDNTYGLAAYVYTRDAARGMRFANALQAGTVRVGSTRGGGKEFPWGGYKESGLGKEGSLYGFYAFANLKRIQVDLRPSKK
jgi:acyl-CoA reductase-like NAD-dependent aldehyde dehydrogenase